MRVSPGKHFFGWVAVWWLVGWMATAHGQTPKELQRKFADLREDKIPLNCSKATLWLFERRDKLKDAMLDELYRTDRQGRDAILEILLHTASFVPDERFDRFVVNRLAEENRYVDANIFGFEYLQGNNKTIAELMSDQYHFAGAHHDAWHFIDDHFEAFRPLLAAQIKTTRSIWELWGTAWMFRKHNALSECAPLYTPAVLAVVAANLQEDDIPYNASMAARLFLILGEQSLPTLRAAVKAKDEQERQFAQDLIEGIKGSHHALIELNGSLNITRDPLGGDEEPEWLTEGMSSNG